MAMPKTEGRTMIATDEYRSIVAFDGRMLGIERGWRDPASGQIEWHPVDERVVQPDGTSFVRPRYQ